MPLSTTIAVGSRSGFHARPAAIFAKAAAATGADVHLTDQHGHRANAVSLLAVLSLNVKHGDALTVTVSGDDEERILDELARLVASDLDV